MTCTLCSQPITVPLIEVWCSTCGTYVRVHDGCTPGVESTKHGVSAEARARILEAHRKEPNGHGAESECDYTRRVRKRRWDPDRDALHRMPLDRPEHLREAKHVAGSTVPLQVGFGLGRKR